MMKQTIMPITVFYLICLQVMDALSTIVILKLGGGEGNFLVRFFVIEPALKYGWDMFTTMMFYKMALVIPCLYVGIKYKKDYFLQFFNIGFVLVVIWNLVIFVRILKMILP